MSIPAVPIRPGQPRGICSRCQSRGRGIRNFITAGGWAFAYPGVTPGHLTHVFSKLPWRNSSAKTRRLFRIGYTNLWMFLKVCFLNFRYFFISCKHINIKSNNLNYILFIRYRETGNNQREHDYSCILHFAFKTNLAFLNSQKSTWSAL